MDGVNSEGFWEDRSFVELNEELLRKSNLDWFTINSKSQLNNLTDSDYQCAKAILKRGFGDGKVEVVKDPRLCITLPFWLTVCNDLNIIVRVCVIYRDSTEVARSLEKRDGLPFSYSYWLTVNYQQHIENVLHNSVKNAYTTYDQLLQDPDAELARLISELELPLSEHSVVLTEVVKVQLKHHDRYGKDIAMVMANANDLTLILFEMVRAFVDRGRQLTDLGIKQTSALAVIAQREQQLKELQQEFEAQGKQHGDALDVIQQREQQLKELQQEFKTQGHQHGEALDVLQQREQQLKELQQEFETQGHQHGEALDVLQQREQQLKELQQEFETKGKQHGEALDVLQQREQQLKELQQEFETKGKQHGEALDVIQQREQQLKELQQEFETKGKQHGEALDVIQQREQQLKELQQEFETKGKQHGEALDVIQQREQQLKELQQEFETQGKQHADAISVVEKRDAQLEICNQELVRLKEQLDKSLS